MPLTLRLSLTPNLTAPKAMTLISLLNPGPDHVPGRTCGVVDKHRLFRVDLRVVHVHAVFVLVRASKALARGPPVAICIDALLRRHLVTRFCSPIALSVVSKRTGVSLEKIGRHGLH